MANILWRGFFIVFQMPQPQTKLWITIFTNSVAGLDNIFHINVFTSDHLFWYLAPVIIIYSNPASTYLSGCIIVIRLIRILTSVP